MLHVQDSILPVAVTSCCSAEEVSWVFILTWIHTAEKNGQMRPSPLPEQPDFSAVESE